MSGKDEIIEEVRELDRIIRELRLNLEQALLKRAELVGVVKYLTEKEPKE
jgi:hypothetical protein